MRKVQVNLHVEVFGDQVPYGWPEDKRCSFHVYADANEVFEAITAAVAEFAHAWTKHGGFFGRRVDSVTSADDDPLAADMARRLEPSRIIDMQDSRALVEHIRKERGEEIKPIESVADLKREAMSEIRRDAEQKESTDGERSRRR